MDVTVEVTRLSRLFTGTMPDPRRHQAAFARDSGVPRIGWGEIPQALPVMA